MKKNILVSILIILFSIIITFLIISDRNDIDKNSINNDNNVEIENGVQIIKIDVGGGYAPRKSYAKANIPTIIRFNTTNSFDCSSSVVIKSLNISKMLPQTGSEDVDIGISKSGKLRGTCSMGMYFFDIDFI